tara:strand:- start:2959 stop:3840 length:882 start_codon:yes stop_codon:yes gene_type:complete
MREKKNSISSLFFKFKNEEIKIIRELSGGSASSCFQIVLNNGEAYFLKTLNSSDARGVFKKEVDGLNKLDQALGISTPKIHYFDEDVLILDYIESGREKSKSWFQLGVGLAQVHLIKSDFFGFDYDNYIGRNLQVNTQVIFQNRKSWGEFFFKNRIGFQLDLMLRKRQPEKYSALNLMVRKLEEKIIEKISSDDEPSLIHGDLWSGNVIFDLEENPVLIDPAVYFGNREAEFGMITLFGGFSPSFFKGYFQEYPLQEGWEKRVQIYQLYHLLNHLNLFGDSYYNSITKLVNNL